MLAPSHRTRFRRWTRRLGGLVLAVYGVWLVVAHALLWSGGLAAALTTADRSVEHGLAWTPWPTRIYARELGVRIDQRESQWFVAAGRARVDVELWPLLDRRLSVATLELDGVRLHARSKLPRTPASERRVLAFPPMRGSPAFTSHGPACTDTPSEPPTPADWTIALENLDADIVQLWIDEYRLDGFIRVRGRGQLDLDRDVVIQLSGAGVEFAGAALTIADEPIGDRLRGSIAGALPATSLAEALGTVTLAAQLEFWVEDLAPLPIPGALELSGGRGPVRLQLETVHGVVNDASFIDYRSDDVRLFAGDASLTAELELVASVSGFPSVPRAHIVLQDGRLRSDRAEFAAFDRLTADVVASSSNLATMELAEAELRSHELVLTDLAELARVIPDAPMDLRGGSGVAQVRAQIEGGSDGGIHGDVYLELDDFVLAYDDETLEGSGTLTVKGAYERGPGVLRIRDSGYDLRELVIASEDGRSDPTWLHGRLDTLHWTRASGLEAEAQGAFGSLNPLRVHVPDLESWIPRRVHLGDDDEFIGFDVALLRPREGVWRVGVDELRRRPVVVTGVYRKVDERYRGAFLATQPLRVGVRVETDEDRKTVFGARQAWLEASRAWVAELE